MIRIRRHSPPIHHVIAAAGSLALQRKSARLRTWPSDLEPSAPPRRSNPRRIGIEVRCGSRRRIAGRVCREAYEARGILRRANGDRDGAIRDFGEAIRLDPRMVGPCAARRHVSRAWRARQGARRLHARDTRRADCRQASTSSLRQATRSSAGCRKRSTISASRAGSIRGCQTRMKAMRALRRRSRRAAGRSRPEIPEFGAQGGLSLICVFGRGRDGHTMPSDPDPAG
jgi:hypothetical protein